LSAWGLLKAAWLNVVTTLPWRRCGNLKRLKNVPAPGTGLLAYRSQPANISFKVQNHICIQPLHIDRKLRLGALLTFLDHLWVALLPEALFGKA
jgi:hypothetical protein